MRWGIMALIEDLQVSLKDFAHGTRVLSNRAGPIFTVSERLYVKLNDYATREGIPLTVATERLRDEIQSLK
jgi:hypothetical protein